MTDAVYSFLPWMRRGIGASGATIRAGALRASVRVDVKVSGKPRPGSGALAATVGQDIELYGPGDVVGIQSKAIIRTDPAHWAVNVEPNYLPLVEFYEEDFPWRYTPVQPMENGKRLIPWLTLLVLAEGEFEEVSHTEKHVLSVISVADGSLFPTHSELWAWSHVHMNGQVNANTSATVSNDVAGNASGAAAMLDSNSDLGYSRLLSSRKLEENTGYHAFVIPSFETGRLAGLGLDPAAVSTLQASASAWAPYANRTAPTHYPIYHRWFFRTGAGGDFEFLVKQLKPVTLDAKVGSRDLDVQIPGPPLPGILDEDLGGILKLGGALRVPAAALKPAAIAERTLYENWNSPYPHPFQSALASFINLEDDYKLETAASANVAAASQQVQTSFASAPDEDDDDDTSPDPLITAPLYGRWHAAINRLLTEKNGAAVPNPKNWIHELNLDPAHRVAASAGTDVIKSHQEDYMRFAWEQVGDIIEANRRLRLAQYATQVSQGWFENRMKSVAGNAERILRLTKPLHSRVKFEGKTVAGKVSASLLPTSLLSFTATRMLRQGGRLARHSNHAVARMREGLLNRVATGEIRVAPIKTAPPGLITMGEFATKGIKQFLKKHGKDKFDSEQLRIALELMQPQSEVKAILSKLEIDPDFTVEEKGRDRPDGGQGEKTEGKLYRQAFSEWLDLVAAHHSAGLRPVRPAIDIRQLATTMVAALEPQKTIRQRTLAALAIPARVADAMIETFDQIWHHPVIDKPMYEPLQEVSTEFILPNLVKIPENSISLLETNQKFIEAYMVGLNHEFSRELLWREYPTDQRGSVFRQFWDVRSQAAKPGQSAEDFRESVRDIRKIHKWPKASVLGTHDNREAENANLENAVLAIRGELLKKYPNTVIYAQRAKWVMKNGLPDLTEVRELVTVNDGEFVNPPREKMRFPLYEASCKPDIRFIGFDLTIDEAKGQPGTSANADAGWFFVIKERPGEPRFGLDQTQSPLQVANDLSWNDALTATPGAKYLSATGLSATSAPTLQFQEPPVSNIAKHAQWAEDRDVALEVSSSARWAYLLYQAPVMVAIHAAEMLKSL